MNIFVLTGAGVSDESGLGTFRDREGLWARFDPMRLATPEAFARAPEQVHAFYNMRRQNLLQAEPNEAHRALARLEVGLAERGGSLFLCTQNIDDLHERAGSKQVVRDDLPVLPNSRWPQTARGLVRGDATGDGRHLRCPPRG